MSPRPGPDMGDLLRGYAVVTLCGWAVFPFLHRVFPRLPDRGYAASRCLGILLTAWIAFAWAGVTHRPLSPAAARAAIAAAALVAVGARALVSVTARGGMGADDETLSAFLRRGWRWVAAIEAIVLGGYVLFDRLLAHNPAVDPDSERMMDYALLKAVLRSPGLPAADPWFGGEPLNYYHFGYAIVAVLLRAAGSSPQSFLIVALAAVHALVWAGAFGCGLAIHARGGSALGAALLTLGAGNAEWIRQWIERGTLAGFDWFAPSRVIPGTITEFPWFSLLWGDLHPYVIALPVFLAAINVGLGEAGPTTGDPSGGERAASIGRWAAVAFAAGACFAIHAWDLPILLLALALLVPCGVVAPRRGAVMLLCAAGGPVLFFQVLRGFRQEGRGVAWVREPSDPLAWVLAFGPFVLLALPLLAALPRLIAKWREPGGAAGTRRDLRPAAAIATAGLLAALLCEVFYVVDQFAAVDLPRMNTVFKWHRLAWVLLALASPAALRALRRSAGRAAAAGALIAVAGAAGVYPVVGTSAWLRDRAAMADAAGTPESREAQRPGATADALFAALFPGDAAVVEVLRARARPGDVLLEESGAPYTWSARIATFSGVSAVLGWGNHEAGWRQDWGAMLERQGDVAAIYADPSSPEARALIRRYGIRWVVVGDRERARYGNGTADRFRVPWTQVFEQDGTHLFAGDDR